MNLQSTALTLDERGIICACAHCQRRNRIAYGRLGPVARCSQCHAELPAPAESVDMEDAREFAALVAGAAVPVLVDFWAPWCGPCKMVAPELAKVAAADAIKGS